jgi:hypothetical protein
LLVVEGEEVIEGPGDVEVEAGGLFADADFVVGAPRARGHVGR